MINKKSFYIICTTSLALYAYLLLKYYSFSLLYDDSLFFNQGINYYSVVEFSPHFPGYPTFIIFLKFVNLFFNDSFFTLHFINIISIIASILISSFILIYFTKNYIFALFMVISLIFSSLILFCALSMLSDSFGMTFFLLSYYLILKKRFKSAGIVLAFAFFARPSYFILIIFLLFFYRNRKILMFFIFTSFLILFLLFFKEGSSYFSEASRFLKGHFFIWGKGIYQDSLDTTSWQSVFFNKVGILKVFLFFIPLVFLYKKELSWLFICYFVWIVFFQNPNNIRHLLPLYFLGHILFFIFINKLKYKKIQAIFIFLLFFSSNIYKEDFKSNKSALTKAMEYLPKNSIVISNYGIYILKSKGFIVLDKYYFYSVKSYIKNNSNKRIFSLSTKEKSFFKNFKKIKVFKKRVYFEKDIYLFQLIN